MESVAGLNLHLEIVSTIAASRALEPLDETTSTLLEFDIVDLDKPVRKELLESIKREGVVLYEKI